MAAAKFMQFKNTRTGLVKTFTAQRSNKGKSNEISKNGSFNSFCLFVGLDPSAMRKVHRGERAAHKGWVFFIKE